MSNLKTIVESDEREWGAQNDIKQPNDWSVQVVVHIDPLRWTCIWYQAFRSVTLHAMTTRSLELHMN